MPIKFVGVGEKLDALEEFHPDRMARRILGMGDVLGLIESAEERSTRSKAKELEQKLRKAKFTLEDLLDQLQQIRKMGSLVAARVIPGVGKQLKGINVGRPRAVDRDGGDLLSMTPRERELRSSSTARAASASPRARARASSRSTSCCSSTSR